jgi:hypothetical protein
MKRLLVPLSLIFAVYLGYTGVRIRGGIWDTATGALVSFRERAADEGVPGDSPVGLSRIDERFWTFVDGTTMEAVLLSADSSHAQFRVLESQGVGQLSLELLEEADRERIRAWVRAEGIDGVAGFPVPLKTHRWPRQWRRAPETVLRPGGEPGRWSSEHFEIANEAGIGREALESITLICESVDGALSALPLPLPLNWGRGPDQRRRVVIERGEGTDGGPVAAGYWDSRTGVVHVNADALVEPDMQFVVFEFDKPEKVQKYDVIVHEVTHQSTAALSYLGVPAWVTEGLAEYLSATHFAPAYFDFANPHVAVRHHINKNLLGDRVVKERRMNVTHLEKMMNRSLAEWNRVIDEGDSAGFLQYSEALLLMHYFFHHDHSDGVHFRRYLETVLSGLPEPHARELHLLRGRSYRELEQRIAALWRPLGFVMNYQDRGELRRGDVAIDWSAEEVKRTIASRRAMEARSRAK